MLRATSASESLSPHREAVALRPFVVCVVLLLAIGTMLVFSASITAMPSDFEQIYLSRQITFLTLAILAGTCCAVIPPAFWERAAPFLFLMSLLLLFAVLLPGVGTSVNGARRWLRLGPVSLQPSETAKITLTLLLARIVVRQRQQPTVLARMQVLFAYLITAALVISEPDLGTTVFLMLIATLVLFFGGWPLREFFVAGAIALPAIATFLVLRPYQWRRLEGFVTTWTAPELAPYQVRQSLTTLGVGGWWGAGLGEGWQKLSFLPEANTDFIFAVVGEELGLVGTLSVVVLWVALLLFGRKLLQHQPEYSFAAVAGGTLLTQLVMQAAINVAVVTAMLPPKGISHPFISYGGSSLLVSCVAVGIIVGLSRSAQDLNEIEDGAASAPPSSNTDDHLPNRLATSQPTPSESP